MTQRDHDTYVLSTGREVSANQGLISIARNGDGFRIAEGYDGGIRFGDPDIDEPEDLWTVAERVELADFMIAQWQAFRAAQVAR